MKHIHTFKSFLNESEEKPYPFKEEDEVYDDEDELLTAEYIFNSPSQQYKVVFYSGEYRAYEGKFDLSFGVNRGNFNKIDTFEMTGEGNVRTLLKTITTIIEKFLDSYGYDKTVIIDATDEKRRRLYKTLIPQYLSAKTKRNVEIK